MRRPPARAVLALHLAVPAGLAALYFVLPDYHHLAVTRIMVLASFALGYNILFGYTGLLSLGHALFFATGLYAAGLSAYHLGLGPVPAFALALAAGVTVSALVGAIALRTTGVAFMIVTLMFSQVAWLATLYFTTWTRGDEGLVLPATARSFTVGGLAVDLTLPAHRYFLALTLLTVSLLVVYRVATGPGGRALVAIRENEARTRMLGYHTYRLKLKAVILSGTLASAAGGAWALLFAYVGSGFAGIQYSIDALLYTLLGGAGTVLGPLAGTAVMFYLVDYASEFTSAWLLVTGIALVLLVRFFPRGLVGTARDRWWPWLP